MRSRCSTEPTRIQMHLCANGHLEMEGSLSAILLLRLCFLQIRHSQGTQAPGSSGRSHLSSHDSPLPSQPVSPVLPTPCLASQPAQSLVALILLILPAQVAAGSVGQRGVSLLPWCGELQQAGCACEKSGPTVPPPSVEGFIPAFKQ